MITAVELESREDPPTISGVQLTTSLNRRDIPILIRALAERSCVLEEGRDDQEETSSACSSGLRGSRFRGGWPVPDGSG
jgi:hypothetical protein